MDEILLPEKMEVSDKMFLSELEPWMSIETTWAYQQMMGRTEKIKAWFTGNQFGKNTLTVKQYIARIAGIWPVEELNMRPNIEYRTLRFCCDVLPNSPDRPDGNTIYPVFLKYLPPSWIKQRPTSKNANMVLIDPQGGNDIYFEFVSYSQELTRQAGVQRFSIWIDEHCSWSFFEEQLPRLVASDGDIIITMTPATAGIGWQYEEIMEKAGTIIRTPAEVKRWNEYFQTNVPLIEKTGLDDNIVVCMAATQDNPLYKQVVHKINTRQIQQIQKGEHPVIQKIEDFKPVTVEAYIADRYSLYKDDETLNIRQYGIFEQVSGVIFKDFNRKIHVIREQSYFGERGIPFEWSHFRGWDYHSTNDEYIGFIALSPDNEAFIYDELVLDPSRYLLLEITRMVAEMGKDYKYKLNKIDPLANEKKLDSGYSITEDINRYFQQHTKDGVGTGGYWEPWDTKGTRGRESVKERLKNSLLCGKPFNNHQIKYGEKVTLPTLWVLDSCVNTIECLKNWRLEEWKNRTRLEEKEKKETPQQRFSHKNMIWECLMKESSFRPPVVYEARPRKTASNYMRR
jgi:hypothetical protein